MRGRAALIVLVLVLVAAARPARADCIDEQARAKLMESKRADRGTTDRLFVKSKRHELSLFGGYYVSDLFDGTYIVDAAYTYHLTEDFGVEGSFGFSQVRSSVASTLEAERGVAVLPSSDRMYLAFTDLVWSPLHGKAEIFSGTLLHFDFFGVAGVGLVDNATSLGIAGQVGVGSKVFLNRFLALRVDVRDQIYQQQVLATAQVVNDFALTFGVSVFLPMTP